MLPTEALSMPSFLLRRSCGGRWRASDLSRPRRSRSLARCNWLLRLTVRSWRRIRQLPGPQHAAWALADVRSIRPVRQGPSMPRVHPDSLGVLAEFALQDACGVFSPWVSKRQGALWRSFRGTPFTGACRLHAWHQCLSVGLSVCVCMCMCACERACVRALVCVRVCTRGVRACVCMLACVRVFLVFACVCVRVRACLRA